MRLKSIADTETPVAYSLQQGRQALQHRSQQERQQHGQFLTPAPIAQFMARQCGMLHDGVRILDPATGSGTLACALIEQVVHDGTCRELFLDCLEIDPLLCASARAALDVATAYARGHGVHVHLRVIQADAILACCMARQGMLFDTLACQADLQPAYDVVIANPPYFKLNQNDPRARASASLVAGSTNVYTIFMALAARLLADQGRACFIVPRSFCSGRYFAPFRREFLRQCVPTVIHIFESRSSAFTEDTILQENIIIAFRKRASHEQAVTRRHLPPVTISYSQGSIDLLTPRQRCIPSGHFAANHGGELFFRLPVTDLDEEIIKIVDTWTGSLLEYGLRISTGPVVPFRARSLLTDAQAVQCEAAVPLLWMQNVLRQQVEWPTERRNKPQGLLLNAAARPLLVPVRNYVLLRRFSAKEDARRMIAAPFLAGTWPYPWIGLENHLNYIYSDQRDLTVVEVCGLAALLNSALLDRYMRVVNGTTQINATDLRVLPLPPLDIIRAIGERLSPNTPVADLDDLVLHVLRTADTGFENIPTITEARLKMRKIYEAQEILKALGLPKAQQNEIAALTLLVLAQLSENDTWNDARRQSLGIHGIMGEMASRYDRKYAENTRETVRRQVIHQFVQAGIVIRNPDEPTLPTNSPRTHYALSDETIRTIRTYGTNKWQDAVASFILQKGALLDLYQKQYDQHKVALVLEKGQEYHLSPGKHNELQAAIVEEFGPRFAPGARLLYLGDTSQKTLILDKAGFNMLGIPIPNHDKLPDVVLYDTLRNWLFLIEAVTSHGPISPKRRIELEEAMQGCLVGTSIC